MTASSMLLDTHVWIWSILEPHRLTQSERDVIELGEHELWLSPISVWELMLLSNRGKVDVGGDIPGWIEFAHREFPVRDAVVNRAIAYRSRLLDLPTDDPADRFIAATAVERGFTLLTHDRALLASPDVPTFAA